MRILFRQGTAPLQSLQQTYNFVKSLETQNKEIFAKQSMHPVQRPNSDLADVETIDYQSADWLRHLAELASTNQQPKQLYSFSSKSSNIELILNTASKPPDCIVASDDEELIEQTTYQLIDHVRNQIKQNHIEEPKDF